MSNYGATGTPLSGTSDKAKSSHLNTPIESGSFSEKIGHQPTATMKPVDEDEDEDLDALIDELESNDGHAEDENENQESTSSDTGRDVPEEMLRTDTRTGLTEEEVQFRRKKYGLNQMKEEKQSNLKKFALFFVGPIQYVMEVGLPPKTLCDFLNPLLAAVISLDGS